MDPDVENLSLVRAVGADPAHPDDMASELHDQELPTGPHEVAVDVREVRERRLRARGSGELQRDRRIGGRAHVRQSVQRPHGADIGRLEPTQEHP
jgi:hypothetical protein